MSYNKTLIIGNGFDLDLGLKTDYSSFIASDEFISLLPQNNLATYIQSVHSIQNWVDVENEFKNYVDQCLALAISPSMSPNSFFQGKVLSDGREFLFNLRTEFVAIKATLSVYLKKQLDSWDIEASKNSNAYKLLSQNDLFQSGAPALAFNNLYSFNYINMLKHLKIDSLQTKFIHGSLSSDNIIFGTNDVPTLAGKYSFLFKSYHEIFGRIPATNDWKNAHELHFFGCSLGNTDHDYFKPLFQYLRAVESKSCKLYFYVYGEEGFKAIFSRIMFFIDNQLANFKRSNQLYFYDSRNSKLIDQKYMDNLA